MPPKQKQGGSKAPKDDKTFGMKNKNKSAKVQRQVNTIKQQDSMRGKTKEDLAAEKKREAEAKAKFEQQKRDKLTAELVKPVQIQRVPFGVDPKSILCNYFKAGRCEKSAAKCKFSHDLEADRKTAKKDLYADTRDEEKSKDTMDKWDQEKLAKVALSKAGNQKTTTDVVCKYFIQSVEDSKYGWFWECPNGGSKCMYRHALPPGFVLKAQRKAEEEAAKSKVITLEEFLETERFKLGKNLTPVTPESFAKWKKARDGKKAVELEAAQKAKANAHAAGKVGMGSTGKDFFTFNPDFLDEEDDGADEWDLATFRKQRAAEDDAAEATRLEAFNTNFRNLHLDDEGNPPADPLATLEEDEESKNAKIESEQELATVAEGAAPSPAQRAAFDKHGDGGGIEADEA
uniref:C3H1-type domain-containing protein n=1 Tax=Bartheletia paradoxa TaxID=669517 RepID=A0A2D0XI65_9BASI|nr:hypothetical protein SPAR05042 [Bartheletia paradoxa]